MNLNFFTQSNINALIFSNFILTVVLNTAPIFLFFYGSFFVLIAYAQYLYDSFNNSGSYFSLFFNYYETPINSLKNVDEIFKSLSAELVYKIDLFDILISSTL